MLDLHGRYKNDVTSQNSSVIANDASNISNTQNSKLLQNCCGKKQHKNDSCAVLENIYMKDMQIMSPCGEVIFVHATKVLFESLV